MKTINKPAKVWYLELIKPLSKPIAIESISIRLQVNIDSGDYIKRYHQVGGKWGWSSRLILSNLELESILKNQSHKIYYAYLNNSFIGYYELKHHNNNNMEVVYFGLIPQELGKGLGKLLMYDAQQRALSYNPERIWLHTCEFDSPYAVKFYQNTGFEIYDEKIENQTVIIK